MVKTKTTSSQLPRGSLQLDKSNNLSKHIDTVNLLFSHEHYGKYLVVTNSTGQNRKHNRQYICFDAMVEFLSPSMHTGSLNALKKQGKGDSHLLSRFPKHYTFIQNSIFKLIKPYSSRKTVDRLLSGFSHFLKVLGDIDWLSFETLNRDHIKLIEQDAKENEYSKTVLGNCTSFLNVVVSYYKMDLIVPAYMLYASKSNKINEISIAVSWQCDRYACMELDETICLVNEYKEWMLDLKTIQEQFSEKELKQHGGIFTLNNIVFSSFDNIDKLGHRSSISFNRVLQRLAMSLYGIQIKTWEHTSRKTIEERKQEDELRIIGKGGINISIHDERMFAIWHKIVAPNYPFITDFLPQYACIQKVFNSWRNTISKKYNFSLERFDKRIYPNLQTIYPLYLLSLCRSGLNQQPIRDWRVWKDIDNSFHLGIDSGMGRIVDGYKSRGNSIQSTALDHKHCKYIDFWCNYAKSLYEASNDDHFFQYLQTKTTEKGKDKVHILGASDKSISGASKNFLHRNIVIDIFYKQDGTITEENVRSIKHEKIRKVKNLSEYIQGKEQWERQFKLGHKNQDTELFYQKTAEFQGSIQHRINMSMNDLIDFFKGRLSVEERPELQIFAGPLSNCSNPFEPTYIGAKEIKDGDVCTNWRKCLTKCDKSELIKHIHAANIMSWRIVMSELHSIYSTEEWDRMCLLDDMAAEAALKVCGFTNEERVVYEAKAKEEGRLAFIRKEVLHSHRSRRLSKDEKHNV